MRPLGTQEHAGEASIEALQFQRGEANYIDLCTCIGASTPFFISLRKPPHLVWNRGRGVAGWPGEPVVSAACRQDQSRVGAERNRLGAWRYRSRHWARGALLSWYNWAMISSRTHARGRQNDQRALGQRELPRWHQRSGRRHQLSNPVDQIPHSRFPQSGTISPGRWPQLGAGATGAHRVPHNLMKSHPKDH